MRDPVEVGPLFLSGPPPASTIRSSSAATACAQGRSLPAVKMREVTMTRSAGFARWGGAQAARLIARAQADMQRMRQPFPMKILKEEGYALSLRSQNVRFGEDRRMPVVAGATVPTVRLE